LASRWHGAGLAVREAGFRAKPCAGKVAVGKTQWSLAERDETDTCPEGVYNPETFFVFSLIAVPRS